MFLGKRHPIKIVLILNAYVIFPQRQSSNVSSITITANYDSSTVSGEHILFYFLYHDENLNFFGRVPTLECFYCKSLRKLCLPQSILIAVGDTTRVYASGNVQFRFYVGDKINTFMQDIAYGRKSLLESPTDRMSYVVWMNKKVTI